MFTCSFFTSAACDASLLQIRIFLCAVVQLHQKNGHNQIMCVQCLGCVLSNLACRYTLVWRNSVVFAVSNIQILNVYANGNLYFQRIFNSLKCTFHRFSRHEIDILLFRVMVTRAKRSLIKYLNLWPTQSVILHGVISFWWQFNPFLHPIRLFD